MLTHTASIHLSSMRSSYQTLLFLPPDAATKTQKTINEAVTHKNTPPSKHLRGNSGIQMSRSPYSAADAETLKERNKLSCPLTDRLSHKFRHVQNFDFSLY